MIVHEKTRFSDLGIGKGLKKIYAIKSNAYFDKITEKKLGQLNFLLEGVL